MLVYRKSNIDFRNNYVFLSCVKNALSIFSDKVFDLNL